MAVELQAITAVGRIAGLPSQERERGPGGVEAREPQGVKGGVAIQEEFDVLRSCGPSATRIPHSRFFAYQLQILLFFPSLPSPSSSSRPFSRVLCFSVLLCLLGCSSHRKPVVRGSRAGSIQFPRCEESQETHPKRWDLQITATPSRCAILSSLNSSAELRGLSVAADELERQSRETSVLTRVIFIREMDL